MTEPTGVSVRPGDVYWLRPDATVGREQAGRRPFVIVAPATYLELVDSLALGVPISMTDRGWPNHVPIEIAGLSGFAMTEQLRTISRSRFDGHAGRIDEETFGEIREWLADYLGF